MNQAMERNLEVVGVPMSARMAQIQVLLEQIKDMKAKMIAVEDDKTLAFVEKTERLTAMRTALRRTGWICLNLMEIEQEEKDGNSSNGDGEGENGNDG